MAELSLNSVTLDEYDALAQSIAAKLGCDSSVIGICHDDRMIAMGHSSRVPGVTKRTSAAADTICSRTISARKPIRLVDVQSDPDVRDIAMVSAMNIGAYLGVPLWLDDGRVIGALCAISVQPRIWQQSEQDYMVAVADLAASKIERQLLRDEQRALSKALAENDAILNTLAETRGKALTVHNAAGDLVFANSALRADLNLSQQQMMVLPTAARKLAEYGARSGAVEVELPGGPNSALRVELSAAKDGLTLAEWQISTTD
jgi:GAF domain-containing protein